MEELGRPDKLTFKSGDLAGSMAAIRKVNPAMPVAPTVDIGGQVMVESGAIIETILNRYGPDKLRPGVDGPDYPYHLMWMHHAEGPLATRAIADYRVWQTAPPKECSRLVDSEQVVHFAEDWLATHAWFGGQDFSAADIMMVFPLNFAMELNIVDRARFPRITEWKSRIEARPAYKAMLAKARPDGMAGSLAPLKVHAPAGPRPAAQQPRRPRPRNQQRRPRRPLRRWSFGSLQTPRQSPLRRCPLKRRRRPHPTDRLANSRAPS